jgi:hypothetical protein
LGRLPGDKTLATTDNHNMSKFYLVILGFTFFVMSSCSEKKTENRFIDIDKVNTEILNHTGIDILKFKSKIKRDFNVDPTFYDSIIYNTTVNNTNVLFEKYGYYTIKTNGVRITGESRDSLILNLVKGFALGIKQEDCTKNGTDSLCIVKMDYYNSLSKIELPIGRIENSLSEWIYNELYKKEYLTQEEFEYMTLWWYVLSSVQGIRDQESHEKRQLKNEFGNIN